MPSNDKVLVRFVSRVSPYNPGETAGFFVDEAMDLVKRGVATLVAMDEEGNLVPTKAVIASAEIVTAEQTAAGMFPPFQEASRAATNNEDDALIPILGSEGTRPDVAMRAKSEQDQKAQEEGKPAELPPFVIPAVSVPPSSEPSVTVEGPPPVESGSPEEAERAKASKEAAEKAQENPEALQALLGGGEEPAPEGEEEPKKRGRPRKSE